jgi:hypothetical protein
MEIDGVDGYMTLRGPIMPYIEQNGEFLDVYELTFLFVCDFVPDSNTTENNPQECQAMNDVCFEFVVNATNACFH